MGPGATSATPISADASVYFTFGLTQQEGREMEQYMST